MVNSLGNLGGFVAPYAVGILKDATGNNQSGLLFLSFCLCVTAVATYLYARKRPEGDAALDPAVKAAARVTGHPLKTHPRTPEGIPAMSSITPFPAERTVVLTGAASARGIGRAALTAWPAKAGPSRSGHQRRGREGGGSRDRLQPGVKAIGVGADVSDEVVRGPRRSRRSKAACRRSWPG